MQWAGGRQNSAGLGKGFGSGRETGENGGLEIRSETKEWAEQV